ncbi:hypothetical protein SKAU_G00284560 [Synaphobranchus kaupii]|uniref:Uncharacterized protein n=1 Tax=Synaphobranchus kaupii TaxID=118154 RepID=A0A9Q1EXT7_SYNKA|nr:hypothetical protein SKAU_G00284560 [Synaphobranchus kaupii]
MLCYKKAGIGGSALAWIESYLSERSSQVAWAGDTPLTPTPCARNLGVVMNNRLSLSENIAVRTVFPGVKEPSD